MKELESLIESALSRQPDFQLPSGFTERLVSMMEAGKQKERRREIWWMGFGAFLFVIAFVVVLTLIDFKLSLPGLTFLSNRIELVVFGIAFIALLHILDRKLVRKHQTDL
jgi:hypothetical protein